MKLNIIIFRATEDIDVNAFEFQGGDSYAILSQIPYYKKSDIYAVLSFKTLNEDALLFFSANNFRVSIFYTCYITHDNSFLYIY